MLKDFLDYEDDDYYNISLSDAFYEYMESGYSDYESSTDNIIDYECYQDLLELENFNSDKGYNYKYDTFNGRELFNKKSGNTYSGIKRWTRNE